MKNKIFMAVTADEYELPITFGETQLELAKLLGVSKDAVHAKLHRSPKKCRGWKVICIEMEVDE